MNLNIHKTNSINIAFNEIMAINKKITTLVMVTTESHILLGFKKRGFGSGKWNGFGGKVETGESIEDAAKRELKEECNLICHKMDKIGILSYEFIGDPIILEVHVFHTKHFSGDILESDEMRPKWYSLTDIPYSEMWSDDKLWLPLLLRGIRFSAYFKFEGMSRIIDYVLQEIPENTIIKAIK